MKDATIEQVPWRANIRATRMCREKVRAEFSSFVAVDPTHLPIR
jgi:hypothetical protein